MLSNDLSPDEKRVHKAVLRTLQDMFVGAQAESIAGVDLVKCLICQAGETTAYIQFDDTQVMDQPTRFPLCEIHFGEFHRILRLWHKGKLDNLLKPIRSSPDIPFSPQGF